MSLKRQQVLNKNEKELRRLLKLRGGVSSRLDWVEAKIREVSGDRRAFLRGDRKHSKLKPKTVF